MSDYSTIMRQLRDETHTHNRLGWRDDKFDAFLIGDTMITRSTTTKVRLNENVFKDEELKYAYNVLGTREQWTKGVDTLYNVPHGEPYQYVICTAFGSPLVPLMNYDDWNGIPLAVTTGDSAMGKTTVAKIAINAISSATKTSISGATYLAVSGRASTMGSLVVLFDEMSEKTGPEIRNILYSLSNGRPKIGMQSDGTERKVGSRWKLNSIITGNRNFFFKLTEARDNPEATQMRVMEIDLANYPPIPSFAEKADLKQRVAHQMLANDLVNNTSCVFSEEYLRFIMEHKDELKGRLNRLTEQMSKALGPGSQKERFYVYHMACTLIGGAIAKRFGYINFDLKALRDWAIKHVLSLRDLAEQSKHTPGDKLADMLSDLHGHFIVTRRFESLNSRSGITELPMFPVKAPVAGRIVLGQKDSDYPRVFVTAKAVAEWCKERGYSQWQVRKEFEDANLLRNSSRMQGGARRRDRNVSIGRGVQGVSLGEPRCLEFTYSAAQGLLEGMGPTNVVEFPGKEDKEGGDEAEAVA